MHTGPGIRERAPRKRDPLDKSEIVGIYKGQMTMYNLKISLLLSRSIFRRAIGSRNLFFIDKPLEIDGFGGIFARWGCVAAGCGGLWVVSWRVSRASVHGHAPGWAGGAFCGRIGHPNELPGEKSCLITRKQAEKKTPPRRGRSDGIQKVTS